MLLLTSPAKTMLFTKPLPTEVLSSLPLFPEHTQELITKLQACSIKNLQTLMGISKKLALQNYDRFQQWNMQIDLKNTSPRPAIYTYAGDIFREMNPYAYASQQIQYAQQSLRIISGLYGLVRALDAIKAYRLEMNIKLKTKNANNLYDYWKNTLTKYLSEELKTAKHKVVVNLASKEYSDAIDLSVLPAEVITIEFRQNVRGKIQNIGILSKRARGMMLEFAIKNCIQHVNELKSFKTKGYTFVKETPYSLLFIQNV